MGYNSIPEWPSVFIKHTDTDVFIITIYVDDLLITGPSSSLSGELDRIRTQIDMEDPSSLTKYLGCEHTINKKGPEAQVCFNMMAYLQAAVNRFVQESGAHLTKAATPYAPDPPAEQLNELLNSPGIYANIAASHLMALMYAARMACPTLSLQVTRLAAQVTKWNKDCDRRLVRLFSWVHSVPFLNLQAHASSKDFNNLIMRAWPDADFNGDYTTSKSTSGHWIELTGPNTLIPLAWSSKRQRSTSTSTSEAEIVSISACLKDDALPIQILLSKGLGFPIRMEVMEDNNATLQILKKGYSPSLRHISRTQRVAIGFLHELSNPKSSNDDDGDDGDHNFGEIIYMRTPTADQKGNCFTKVLPPKDFNSEMSRLGVSGL